MKNLEALKYGLSVDVETPEIDFDKTQYIKEIEAELLDLLSDSRGTMNKMCNHILKAGGKRLRPLLVLHSGLIFSKMSDELLKAAAAAELIHMASLVHDDIIDEADLRRGQASINSKWGNHFGVLCGDYLFARAFGILSNNRLISSMDYMVEAIQNMCNGEIMQADDRFKTNINIKTYYDRIAKKTAVFLKCCCKSGAAVGGADKDQLNALGKYGLNLGFAFQIVDDILDFCGSVEVMGKPKMEDLRQGNFTLPVIMLLNSKQHSAWLKKALSEEKYTDSLLDNIASALEDSGAIEKSLAIACSHIDKARAWLESLPEGESITFLHNLAEMMKFRIK